MKEILYENITFKVGQTAQENWDLIDFDSNYVWLHLNSFPSCHVIIYHDDPSVEMLLYGANLCKDNTKYKNLKNLKVCYTRCNNLKRGVDVGSVLYKSNRKVQTITV